jgi:hypothetical protein
LPDASEYAAVKMLANAIDTLSTNENYYVSIRELHGYLAQNCVEAKGNDSATFFNVTVTRGLDQMKQTKMAMIGPNGVCLTENGRWSLLGKGATQSKKVAGDSGGAAKELGRRSEGAARELPAGSLLRKNEEQLGTLGVSPKAPRLLMEVRTKKWKLGKFLKNAREFAPTLLLIKLRNGITCGGVAGVPWPKCGDTASDPAKGSFIFSLGATPARFDLVKSEQALYCGPRGIQFGYNGDLVVLNYAAGCGSSDQGDYAGPRESGQLIGGPAAAYERWELWRL